MGGCCPGKEAAEADNKKFSESEFKGPVENRRCTDIFCCLLYIVHIVVFIGVAGLAFGTGNPDRLIQGQDWRGNFCGMDNTDVIDGGVDMTNFKMQAYAMNATKMFEEMVTNLGVFDNACELKGQNGWPNTTCGSTTFDPEAAQKKADEWREAAGDPVKLYNKLTGGNSGGLVAQLQEWFTPICVSECPSECTCGTADECTDASVNASSCTEFVWEGPKNIWQQPSYTILTSNVVLDSPPLKGTFSTYRMPKSKCPYDDPTKCVAVPGVSFASMYDKYCVPKAAGAASEAVASATGATADAAAAVIPDEFSESIGDGWGTMIGDLQKVWETFIIVGLISFIISMCFLFLLRFILAPLVYLSCMLGPTTFLLTGLFLVIKAAQCVGDNVTDAKAEANTFLDPKCDQGFEVADKELRDVMRYGGFGVMGVGALLFLIVLCLCHRIQLSIALCQVASKFVIANKSIVLLPAIQSVLALIWFAIFAITAVYQTSMIASGVNGYTDETTLAYTVTNLTVPASYTQSVSGSEESFEMQARVYEAYPTAFEKDKCWDTNLLVASLNNQYQYICRPPKYQIGVMNLPFWYLVFSFFWNNAMIIAFGQCTIAGAVGVWYFSEDEQRKSGNTGAIGKGFRNCWRYHLGSLAFGSLILAIIQTIKWWLRYVQKQAEKQGNFVLAKIACILSYYVACMERCVKFLNKNAYIQVALMGTNFCTSARRAFWLILRNIATIGILTWVGFIVKYLGLLLICGATGCLGYLILMAMHENDISSPIFPVFIFVCMGYVMASLTLNVYAMAVDSMLQCYVADEEMGGGEAKFTPPDLKGFVQKNKGEDKGRCCC